MKWDGSENGDVKPVKVDYKPVFSYLMFLKQKYNVSVNIKVHDARSGSNLTPDVANSKEVSDIIKEFTEGRNAKSIDGDAEQFFMEKSLHFCAGYVSNFEQPKGVKYEYLLEGTANAIKRAVSRMINRKNYSAALKAMKHYEKNYSLELK